MAPKKRSSKSQPIRKRKKSRQVLAKVAERKEAHKQKLAKKLDEADARITKARLKSLSVPLFSSGSTRPSLTQSKSQLTVDPSFDHDDDESDQGAIEDCENAYSQLIGYISRPLHADTPNEPVANPAFDGKETSTIVATASEAVDTGSVMGLAASSSTDPPEIVEDISEEEAENENQAAAMREKDHFKHMKGPSDATSTYSTIAEFPHLRVLSSVSNDASETLRTQINVKRPVPLGLQLSALRHWRSHHSYPHAYGAQSSSPLLRSVSATLRAFHDLLLCASLDVRNDNAVRSLYVAHCMSHVLRCRARVFRNDFVAHSANLSMKDESSIRDQGFSRARVLMILPMRNVAFDVVQLILLLASGDVRNNSIQVLNRDRFLEDFSPGDGHDGMDADDDVGGLDPTATIRPRGKKPADHTRLFRGNVDDDFKMGISISKKTVKLYSDFYDSDIIITSPLGLRRANAEKAWGQDKHSNIMREKRKREEDTEWQSGIDSKAEKPRSDENDDGFLSSIEICVVDGANVLSMQNWDTLKRALGMMNKMPSSTRDTDFSRVREWCLDGLTKKFRQSIVLSRYRKSDVMAMFREFCNFSGKVQVLEVPQEHGSMSDVAVQMRQSFFKVGDVQSPVDASERRLKFFFEQTFPAVSALVDSQVLLVVPSYFDYVRVRNRLLKITEEDSSFRFASICEYSKSKDVTRARARFFSRKVSLLVLTERFHFFWRHWIRGANTIVWFGLPENCQFYPEVINMTAEACEAGRPVQSIALYDQFDAFCLERIVGQGRCRKMISKSSRSTFLFM